MSNRVHYALEVQPPLTIQFLLWFPCTKGAAHDHPVGARTARIAGMDTKYNFKRSTRDDGAAAGELGTHVSSPLRLSGISLVEDCG